MSIFNYYPYIEYNNKKGIHILREVEVIKNYLSDYNRFYTYLVQEGERPDIVANKVYNDPTFEWIIYLVNGITDPYYDWVMDEDKFKLYLEQKYNTSIEKLDSKIISSSIKHYYYSGLNSDSQEIINSYNYTMTPETYNYLLAQDPNSVAGWQAYTVYQYERDLNESKREIKLLRSNYINDFILQFKELVE